MESARAVPSVLPAAPPVSAASTASTAASGNWILLGKHQIAAAVCTVVDFGTMFAWIRALHGGVVAGTIAGSLVGAILNFVLCRRWAFHATAGAPGGQALRYGLVALATLVFNAVGMALCGARAAVLVARVVVAAVVSVFWNFPMQRWFVFRTKGSTSRAGA